METKTAKQIQDLDPKYMHISPDGKKYCGVISIKRCIL